MRDILFATLWAAMLPLVFYSPQIGVLLWVWTALLSPNQLLYGALSSVPFDRIAAITTIFMTLIKGKLRDFYLDSTSILLLVFAIIACLSFLNETFNDPSGSELWQKLIKEILLSFFIMMVLTTKIDIERLVYIVVVGVSFLSVKEGLIFILTAAGHKIEGSGSFGDNNSLATALLMAAPLLFYLTKHSEVRFVKTGLFLVLGLTVVTVIATYSRGGFIGLLIFGLFMIKNSRHRFRTLALVATAAAALYVLAPEAWFSRVDTIKSADEDSSFMNRVIAWKISLLIALDHPYLGGGIHAVQNPIIWNIYLPDLSSVDFINTPPASNAPRAAHSIYFEVLGDLGFTGLTAFLLLLATSLWNCRQIVRASRRHPSLDWANDLAQMAQISLIIYATTGAALSIAYLELLYVILALISRCRRTMHVTLREAEPRPARPLHASATQTYSYR